MNRYKHHSSQARSVGASRHGGLAGVVHGAFLRVRESLPGSQPAAPGSQPGLPGFELPDNQPRRKP